MKYEPQPTPKALQGVVGSLVTRDALDDVRDLLIDLQEGGINGEAAIAFVNCCAECVSTIAAEADAPTVGAIGEQIDELRIAATRLLTSLQKLSPEAAELVNDDSHDEPSWRSLDGEALLPALWRAAAEARARIDSSRLVTTTLRLSKGAKTSEQNGRRLVKMVALAFQKRFDRLPPGGERQWFAHFMGVLGRAAKASCGPRVVAGVIKDMQPKRAD